MKCQHVIPSAQEMGKEFSLGQRVKTMVTVDWRPLNRRFEPKKKAFEGMC